MLLDILKLLGLAVSFIGWLYWVHRWLGVDFCFVPAAVCSLVTVLVYFGGIFGVLGPAALAVYFVGVALCAGMLLYFCESGSWPRLHFHLREVCFGAGCALFLSLLPTAQFQHYDNYSHWGIVVKLMLSTDAFPTAETQLIDFLNYPLGTSSFLYYICRFAGHREGTMLLAQGALIFAFFYAIFGAIRHRKAFLLYALLGVGLSFLTFFNITIRINNLLVDFLLPVIALACWAAIQRYPTEMDKLLPLLVPYQALLLIVKSTGAIYLAFTVCAFVIEVPRAMRQLPVPQHGKKANPWGPLLPGAVALALSSLTWLAWQYHTKTAFPNVVNKFDTNLVEVGAAGTGKTPEELQAIWNLFLQTVADTSTRPTLGFLLMNAFALCCALALWLKWHRPLKTLGKAMLWLNLMVVLYYGGILLLYLFSMPADEALVLAGFDRYACSIIVLFAGGVVLKLAQQVEEMLTYSPEGRVLFEEFDEKNRYQKAILISLAVAFGILTSEYNGTLYTTKSAKKALPETMQEVVGDRWPEGGKEDQTKYLLYGSDHDGQMTSYYFQYVARYYLYAPHVDAVCVFYEPNLENLLSQYECLVVVEPDPVERRMLRQHYGVDGYEGFYRVVKTGNGIRLVKEDFSSTAS